MKPVHLFAIAALMLSLALPTPGLAGSDAATEASAGAKSVDMLLVRPFSGIGSVVSSAIFLATLPITFPCGVADDATYVLLIAPWRFTGARELGVYGEYVDGRTVTGRLIE